MEDKMHRSLAIEKEKSANAAVDADRREHRKANAPSATPAEHVCGSLWSTLPFLYSSKVKVSGILFQGELGMKLSMRLFKTLSSLILILFRKDKT